MLLCIAVFLPVASIAQAQEKLTGDTMGTYYSIVLDGVDEAAARAIEPQVIACLADVNRQMSTWDPESEISRFNSQQSTDWFSVSPEFAEVVTEAKRIHELTRGAFDPTLSPLIDLWGFGSERPQNVPSDEQIAAAMQNVGMQKIEVRMEPPAIRKNEPQLQLNLSAIAKGHGVDRVSRLLSAAGYRAHVVDIGGENRAGIAKASGDKWRLGVESPLGGLYKVLEVTESAVATSGDYRNFYTIEGVRYSHALNPTTGKPVKDPPASVSVVHESCMTADALATAMMVLGVEEGLQLASAQGIDVLFQTVTGPRDVRAEGTGIFGTAIAQQSSAWWTPFVAAIGIFLLAMVGMAVGVIFRNKALKGSCGGLASMPGNDGKSICELCTTPRDECVNAEIREQLAAQAAAEPPGSE
jgi:thiamine biosynthesis lipoprotein